MYQSRYAIDESLINRMTILDKWYMKQTSELHSNENSAWLDSSESTIDYLNENEIYGVLLMLFFDSKPEKKDWDMQILHLTKKNKTAFDLIKEEYVWKNENEKKDILFNDLKKFSHFVKIIQNAYEQTWSVMCDGKDISNYIKRRVISMRQIRSILTDYQKDTKPLFYHIYKDFMSQWWWSWDEFLWILLASKEAWLLPLQSSGSLNLDWEWAEKIKSKLKQRFLNQKNSEIKNINLNSAHDKKLNIGDDLLDSRLILTKHDIYKQYFWSDLSDIQDTDILWKDQNEQTYLQQFEGNSPSDIWTEKIDNRDKNIEEIIEQAQEILNLQEDVNYTENPFLSKLDFNQLAILKYCCENIRDNKIKNLDQTKINWLYAVLNKILVYIIDAQDVDSSDINDVILSLKKLTS
jgi:hypothetical protein